MSPRFPVGALPLGALALLAGCGEPPQPMPTAPPPYVSPSQSAAPIPLFPSNPVTIPAVPTYPTYPTYPAAVTTPAPTSKSPTPTPSHAAKCSGPPTRTEIITLVKGQPGVPDKPLSVADGPYCSGIWSFSTVEVTGQNADELEPLMVVATGKGTTLALVAAGSDVCIDRVQNDAPPGIRVLACGF